MDSNELSGDFRSGNSLRRAIMERIPTARQKRPGSVVVNTPNSTPASRAENPEIIRLGGVPIQVHTPPIPEA